MYLNAPDHAEQLVEDCLPTLCEILEDVHCTVAESTSALCFLKEITLRTLHPAIIRSGIVKNLIPWLK